VPALELGGMTLGLREGVIGLIVLVALYMLFVLLRMLLLRRRSAETPGLVAPVLSDREPAAAEPEPELEPGGNKAAPEVAAPDLAEHVLRGALEQEVSQLRDEVDAIRGELAALRGDMLHELAHLRASQTVSPIYGDAMQMAVSGYDPAAIAERCGIARAEAELVVALAKSQNH
jgi:hypothetical protein